MFYAVAKHFVILILNRTKEGLNTISFHGLMPDTYQCFHQLCLRLPWNGYTLWSCLAAELGSCFSVSGNNDWQDTGDRYQHQMRQQWQHCYHSICRQYCLFHQFDNRKFLFLFSLELHVISMELCHCDTFSLYLLPDVTLNWENQEVQYWWKIEYKMVLSRVCLCKCHTKLKDNWRTNTVFLMFSIWIFTLIRLKPANVAQTCCTTPKLIAKSNGLSPNILFAPVTTKIRNHGFISAEICFIWKYVS